MGRNNWFQFKQFKIIQEKTAMKVGTDGVLLGAWVRVSDVGTILDIGTGTGVISLMLAQRSPAKITGVEAEKNAAKEAEENVRQSEWKNRISIRHVTFQEFAQNCSGHFDLIVSNPPFFSNSQKSKSEPLAMARHNHLLPFTELINGAARLLNTSGKLAVILPVIQAEEFIKGCKTKNLHLHRLTEVRPNNLKPPHRCLMEFGQTNEKPEQKTLNIHSDDGSDFTDEYKTLTRDFYLNF